MTERPCGCGCGKSLAGRRRTVLYVDHNHAQRAYRKRVAEALRAQGLPERLSLRSAQTANPTKNRNGDGPRPANVRQASRKRPSGLQVSYVKAHEELHDRLWQFPGAERLIKEALRAALSDRQRQRLDERT